MKSTDIKKLYLVHSWVGLVTGVLLFVIALTGAMSVFGRPEIKIWANPDIRSGIDIDTQRIETLIETHASHLPARFHEEILVFMPGTRSYANLRILFEDHENEEAVYLTFDNQTLEVIDRQDGTPREVFAQRRTDIADFIVDFHADLHLGRPVGLLLTGLLGLTLMASIVTGFIIHRQKLKQLFTFRWRRSTDITLADSHKLFGVWGMIFHGVIGFSGAFLGLATVLLIPAAAFVSFGGDQDKLIETFNTTPEPVLAQVQAPTRIADALEHALSYDQDMRMEVMSIYGYNDKNAVIYVSGVGSDNVSRQILKYAGAEGHLDDVFGQFEKVGGVTSYILDLMFPLHFGNFGGPFVKLLWTVLGLSTALLPLSGLMLWIERGVKAKQSSVSLNTYTRFNRLITGACGGIVLACAALFPTQLYLIATDTIHNTGFIIGCVFFSLWLLAIAWAFLAPSVSSAAKHILYTAGVILLSVLPLNTLITGDSVLTSTVNQQWETLIADVTLFVLGACMVFFTRKGVKASQSATQANKTQDDTSSAPTNTATQHVVRLGD
ncbi:PepSY domain-containing protein [Aestuariibacter sp. AA17]|uniref:PepSY domain-containing protein n=1 Tax=Fluctibacter corallii TaxID=2984329 RepID=A0ABT3A863_9ALTE|nr:PepSY-associated TM helix domain-containing protein [Aestuariibacter sp. AA17]MCV2884861.1 PepSY domain-containing protein [Aestuariibacter sp. AA17]